MIPTVGMKFEHARVLIPDKSKAQTYVVTAIREGCVYYKPIDGGKSEYITIDRFSKIVKGR